MVLVRDRVGTEHQVILALTGSRRIFLPDADVNSVFVLDRWRQISRGVRAVLLKAKCNLLALGREFPIGEADPNQIVLQYRLVHCGKYLRSLRKEKFKHCTHDQESECCASKVCDGDQKQRPGWGWIAIFVFQCLLVPEQLKRKVEKSEAGSNRAQFC